MDGVYTRVGGNPRSFGPLDADHWLVGRACAACGQPFQSGEATCLVPCAPPEGRNVESDPWHWACYEAALLAEAHQ